VLSYRVENGRRYHAYKDGSYSFPNDDQELDRLDMTHHMIKLRIGGLHLAPIGDRPGRVIDVGTGTGIWAIEMGDAYPSAEVIGTDLSPVQPSLVPPNVKFVVDDCEETWAFPNPFDYIHLRFLGGGIKDWARLTGRVFDNLVPGGWVEFQDIDARYYSEDGTYTEELHTAQWIQGLMQAGEKIGRDVSPALKLEERVRDAGFTNVVHRKFKMPIGPWPKDPHIKECGTWNLLQILEGLEGFTLRLFGMLGWKTEEIEVLLAMVRKELTEQKAHIIWD
ncbi:MAG: hypothetical protein M1815_001249, partial [Lichina confinis]